MIARTRRTVVPTSGKTIAVNRIQRDPTPASVVCKRRKTPNLATFVLCTDTGKESAPNKDKVGYRKPSGDNNTKRFKKSSYFVALADEEETETKRTTLTSYRSRIGSALATSPANFDLGKKIGAIVDTACSRSFIGYDMYKNSNVI